MSKKINWTEDEDYCIPKIVVREILSDADYDGDHRVAAFYARLSRTRREAVDKSFLFLCGWTLGTIIKAVQEHVLPDELPPSVLPAIKGGK
jgi:hypothetical protein